MKTASLLIALSFIFNPPLTSGETPRAEDTALLEKLRDENFDTRQDARDKLIARGLSVRELIDSELAKKDLDPDYKIGLKAVASGLREIDTLQPFDAPKRIDLELKDETVSAALEKITAHFGQSVTAELDARDKKVSLSIKGATFMEAADAVRRAADLIFAPGYTPFSPAFSSGRILIAADRADPPPPDDNVRARYKNLMLAERSANAPRITAVNGPFAVVLTGIEATDHGRQIIFLHVAGNLYFNQDARFSRLKFASLKAVDGEKEYNLIVPAAIRATVQFHKLLGKTPDCAPFMCAFTGSLNYPEPIPPGLTWKLTLAAEVPLKTTSESVDLSDALFDTPQSLLHGEVTVASVTQSDGEWSAEFTLLGGAYFGSAERTFNIVTEALPFAPRGLNPSGLSFLDVNGRPLPFRTRKRNITRETGELAYKMDVRMDAKPKTMVLSHTAKTATREFEFTLPSVPVPLNKSEN